MPLEEMSPETAEEITPLPGLVLGMDTVSVPGVALHIVSMLLPFVLASEAACTLVRVQLSLSLP